MSLLVQERGLKLFPISQFIMIIKSLLVQERGLKHYILKNIILGPCRSLYRSVD